MNRKLTDFDDFRVVSLRKKVIVILLMKCKLSQNQFFEKTTIFWKNIASSIVTTVYNVEISHLLVEWQTRVLSAHLSGTTRESYFSTLAFDQNNLL